MPFVSFRVPEDNVYFPYDPISFQPLSMDNDLTTPDVLDEQISHYMPVFAKRIKKIEDNNWFIERFGHLDKVLYFGLDSENPPSYFKGISAYFKDKLEFGIVSPDAYEVIEYYNITTKPKWIVVKVKNTVYMDVRKYQGEFSFSGLRAYLEAIAPKQEINRNDQQDIGKVPLRDQVMKGGLSKLKGAKELDYDNLMANLDHPEDVVIIHVTDTLSMNYPNLLIFQQFYGNLTQVYNFNVNNAPKKRMFRKYFPNEHKPYILVCPRGEPKYKWKHRRVLGALSTVGFGAAEFKFESAHSTVEDLTEIISEMIPDHIEKIMSHELETRIIDSLHEHKLAVVVFHDQAEVSLGLRRLALTEKFRKNFNFYQMVKPPAERLRELKITKLAKLVVFLPDPIYLIESDSQVPIDSVFYESHRKTLKSEKRNQSKPNPGKSHFIFDKLSVFLSDMYSQHAQFLSPPPLANSSAQVLQECIPSELCLLFVLNHTHDSKRELLVDRLNDVALLRKFAGNRARSVLVNIDCFPAVAELFRFQQTQVPLLVVLKRNSKSKIPGDRKVVGEEILAELSESEIYQKYDFSFVRADHKLNPYSSKVYLESVLEGKFDASFRPVDKVNLGTDRCALRKAQAVKLEEDL